MTLRELVAALDAHQTAWPTRLDEPIYIRVGREKRTITTTYMDTGFVLVAGPRV